MKKHILDLPVEVIENILSHVKVRDLKNCALVCNDFNAIIESSSIIMRKFHMSLQVHVVSTIKRETTIKRKHRNITIRDWNGTSFVRTWTSYEVIFFDMSLVTSLEYNPHFTATKVLYYLEQTPLLEKLIISKDPGDPYELSDTDKQPICLNRLTTLTLNDAPTGDFLKVINSPCLTNLWLDIRRPNIEVIRHYFANHLRIKKLHMNPGLVMQLFDNYCLPNLCLTNLTISCYRHFTDSYSESVKDNVFRLLINNAKTLTHLHIDSRLVSERVYKILTDGSLPILRTIKYHGSLPNLFHINQPYLSFDNVPHYITSYGVVRSLDGPLDDHALQTPKKVIMDDYYGFDGYEISYVMQPLLKYGSGIVEFHWFISSCRTIDEILEVLNSMPNMQILVIRNCKLTQPDFDKKLQHKNLHTLMYDESQCYCHEIFNMFTDIVSLTTIKIEVSRCEGFNRKPEATHLLIDMGSYHTILRKNVLITNTFRYRIYVSPDYRQLDAHNRLSWLN